MTVTGDGRPENEFVFVGEKLWKESAMLKLTKNIPTPSPIKESRELLKEKIFRYFHCMGKLLQVLIHIIFHQI